MNSEQGGELDVGQDVDPLTGRPPPQQPAQQPAQRPAAPRARFPWKAVIAAALAAAALAVTVITLLRPTPAAIPASAPITTTPADTTAFDRALCTAMAPLMDEINRISWTYEALGEPGTPARDSALPKFISDVQDWIGRVQPILDQHPDARPFFRRSLQRFIDDRNLLVSDLKPGRWPPKAYAMWSDSEGAYSGPLHICEQVGVKWLR